MKRTIRRPKLLWRNHLPGVVAAVRDQTDQAAQLAQISGQHMLTDPRTNPAVRDLLDQLRNQQHRLQLEAEHGRHQRQHRVADRSATEAELTLQAIQQARRASSPARSVLALHRGRTRFLAAALTASVVVSSGSAAGVEKLATDSGAPALTGYVAEVGMVGFSTLAILYRAHLSQHGWESSRWQNAMLWVPAIVPLLASVVANAMAAGLVGVSCSVFAAGLSAFAHMVGHFSSDALRTKAAEVTGADEHELRAVAMGDDLFSVPPARKARTEEPRTGTEPVPASRAEEQPVRTEPRTTRTESVPASRTDGPEQTSTGDRRTGQAPRTGERTENRTGQPRTGNVTPISKGASARDQWAAAFLPQVRAAVEAGTPVDKWSPDYKALMAQTGLSRATFEKAAKQARETVRTEPRTTRTDSASTEGSPRTDSTRTPRNGGTDEPRTAASADDEEPARTCTG